MAVNKIKRGLNLPVAGAPAQAISPAMPVRRVALLGADYQGLKPALRVQPGDVVQRGQVLFEDKRQPGVMVTAPAAGTVTEINRGARRAFVSQVIEVAPSETQITFSSYTGRAPEQLDGMRCGHCCSSRAFGRRCARAPSAGCPRRTGVATPSS